MMAAVPDEVLLKVFSSLSVQDLVEGVRLTCVRWSALSYDRSLWSQYKVAHLTSTPSCGIKGIMQQLRYIVEDLTLENVSHALHDFITGPECRNLKALRLRWIDVPAFDFENLISTYPLLEQLFIFKCETSLSINNNTISQVKHLSRLRHLEINPHYGNYIILDNDVFANMPDLVSLKLVGVYLTNFAIGVLLNNALKLKKMVIGISFLNCGDIFPEIHSDYTALEKLSLSHSTIHDTRLIQIAKKSPKLRSLSLKRCSYITEKSVIIVTDVCNQLESLRVSGYEDLAFSNEGWMKIVDNCPQLRKLRIPCMNPEIGDDIICHLAVCCPKLEYLQLYECHITDESINAISMFSTQLRVLDISRCKQVTGAAISKVVVNCKRLTSLSLHKCSGIRDLNFNAFYEKLNAFDKTFNKLSEMFTQQELSPVNDNINGAMFIPNQDVGATQHANLAFEDSATCACPSDRSVHYSGLEAIPVCSHLSFLDLSYTNITPSSLVQVALHCPGLESLEIESCSMVTEESVLAVIKRCRHLEELVLSCKHDVSMTSLSDSTLRAIARFSAKLDYLRINFNSLITIGGIREVIEKCKLLKSFSFDTGPLNAVTNEDVFEMAANITDRCVECKVFKDDPYANGESSDSDSDDNGESSDSDSDDNAESSDSDSDDNGEFSDSDPDDIGEFSKRNIMLILLKPKS